MPSAPMGGEADSVHEPRVVADARADTAGVVLRTRKRFEVIVVDRLRDARQGRKAQPVQQLGVPAEACDTFGHGAGRTTCDAGDLPVGASVDDAPSDRDGQFGAFEVVAHRERLLREAVTTGPAKKAWDDPAVTAPLVRRAEAAIAEGSGLDPVLRTVRARAERRCELIVRDALDLGARPIHENSIRQAECPAPETDFTRLLVRQYVRSPAKPSARGQLGRTICEPLWKLLLDHDTTTTSHSELHDRSASLRNEPPRPTGPPAGPF